MLQPKLKRIELFILSSGIPIARSTEDGKPVPELHADPVETATPSISKAINKVSPSTPSKPKFKVLGSRFTLSPNNSVLGIISQTLF